MVENFLQRDVGVTGIDLKRSALPSTAARYQHLQLDWSETTAPRRLLDHLDGEPVDHIVAVAGGALPAEVDANSRLHLAMDASDATIATNLTTAVCPSNWPQS